MLPKRKPRKITLYTSLHEALSDRSTHAYKFYKLNMQIEIHLLSKL